jgi:hypothetical protein
MQRTFISLLILGALSLTACRSKLSSEGVYTFPEHPISVRAPRECVVDMSIGESSNTVDFNTGRYYWEMSGQFFVIVSGIPDDVIDGPSFIASMKPWFAETFQPRESEFFKLDLEVADEYEMAVNGDPAYRMIFEDPGEGIVVATARLHRQRITIAALAYSFEGHTESQVPWECYEAFVGSVSEIPDAQ